MFFILFNKKPFIFTIKLNFSEQKANKNLTILNLKNFEYKKFQSFIKQTTIIKLIKLFR